MEEGRGSRKCFCIGEDLGLKKARLLRETKVQQYSEDMESRGKEES